MESININVEEKDVTVVQKITSVQILEGKIDLEKSATFPVKLIDVNGNLISLQFIKIEGTDYNNWGNNDNYIVDLIINKLGLTPTT
jgi:hypothetical protein